MNQNSVAVSNAVVAAKTSLTVLLNRLPITVIHSELENFRTSKFPKLWQ